MRDIPESHCRASWEVEENQGNKKPRTTLRVEAFCELSLPS